MSPIDIILLLYIICFIWETLQATYRDGIKRYTRDVWLGHQVILCICFVGSYVFGIISYIVTNIKASFFLVTWSLITFRTHVKFWTEDLFYIGSRVQRRGEDVLVLVGSNVDSGMLLLCSNFVGILQNTVSIQDITGNVVCEFGLV